VPTWGGGPAIIEISGETLDLPTHDAVLRLAREEASRLRPDVKIEDRLMVRRAVAASVR